LSSPATKSSGGGPSANGSGGGLGGEGVCVAGLGVELDDVVDEVDVVDEAAVVAFEVVVEDDGVGEAEVFVEDGLATKTVKK
jgi:hypothetical protein